MSARRRPLRSWIATAAACVGVATAAHAQEAPPIERSAADAEVARTLREVRAGNDVDANVEKLRAALKQTRDGGRAATGVGVELLRGGLYEAAGDCFEIARAKRPEDATPPQLLGLALVMQNRYAEALAPLHAAASLLPPGPHPYQWQYESMALGGLQRNEEAVAVARRAIDDAKRWNAGLAAGQAPLDVLDLELNLMTLLQRAHQFGDALAVLDRLPLERLTQKELAKATLARAQLLAAKGDDDGALAAFTRHGELAPQSATGWYEFALFHQARGETTQARQLFEKVVALDPSHEGAHFNLARVLLRAGEAEAGRRMMARYRELQVARIATEVRMVQLRDALHPPPPPAVGR